MYMTINLCMTVGEGSSIGCCGASEVVFPGPLQAYAPSPVRPGLGRH